MKIPFSTEHISITSKADFHDSCLISQERFKTEIEQYKKYIITALEEELRKRVDKSFSGETFEFKFKLPFRMLTGVKITRDDEGRALFEVLDIYRENGGWEISVSKEKDSFVIFMQ